MQSRIACHVQDTNDQGAFTLDCPLSPGASGAPVLRRAEAGFEIIGVVSATAAHRSLAFDVTAQSRRPACDDPSQD